MTTEDSTENMPECTQCPHIIGDYTERDCGFPDCMGGWESAYKAFQAELDRRVTEAEEKIFNDIGLWKSRIEFNASRLRDCSEDHVNGYVRNLESIVHEMAEYCAILNAGGKGDE